MDRVNPPAASAAATATTDATADQYRISSSTTTTTATTSSSSSKKKQTADDHQRALLLSERNTLEKLHTEITALAEQMNQLGQDVRTQQQSASGMKRHNYVIKLGWRLVKTLLRHLLVNILMTGFVFWILWHQQSPTAHAMIDFLTPHIRALVRSSLKKILFWKLTV
ncbi:hypothetical protein BCR42DRAFT_316947 [Absidia repens]|uniref:Uncharacterized protein n=1 Tax=Absidia repens TaxID=90262 RepID=A0A1X2IXC0_9FUNG|nr:hypothetical protein BCR42DRAFT_316947 [Absidia repens]